jgi:hypothetical protein
MFLGKIICVDQNVNQFIARNVNQLHCGGERPQSIVSILMSSQS